MACGDRMDETVGPMQKRATTSLREIALAHLPDGLRHTDISGLVSYDPALVIQREGDCFVAEVGPFDASDSRVRNHFHVGEKLVQLRSGDRIPLILAYRRSMMSSRARRRTTRCARAMAYGSSAATATRDRSGAPCRTMGSRSGPR
jgi:hypothetical protein